MENGVIMTNLYVHDEIEAQGVFIDGEFKFESFDTFFGCSLRTTATLKSSNNGLDLNIKHAGINGIEGTFNCNIFGFTCEGLVTKI